MGFDFRLIDRQVIQCGDSQELRNTRQKLRSFCQQSFSDMLSQKLKTTCRIFGIQRHKRSNEAKLLFMHALSIFNRFKIDERLRRRRDLIVTTDVSTSANKAFFNRCDSGFFLQFDFFEMMENQYFSFIMYFTYSTLSSFHVGSLPFTISVRNFCFPMPNITEAWQTA